MESITRDIKNARSRWSGNWVTKRDFTVRYKLSFVDDVAVWLLMLKKRNTSVHIYNEQEVDEMILLIRDSFIPAFVVLEKTLRSKLEEVKNDWE